MSGGKTDTERIKQLFEENNLKEFIELFCNAYQIQKGVDFDDVELCHHMEANGKRAVIYFRSRKKKNLESTREKRAKGKAVDVDDH